MSLNDPERFDHLLDGILAEIERNPGGVSEFDLIRALAAQGVPCFSEKRLSRPLELYQIHFILFHCLYRLRHLIWRDGGRTLDIHCLSICLGTGGDAGSATDEAAMTSGDPLAAFYLNLDNLEVDEEQVVAMLSGFWMDMDRGSRRVEALRTLGLADPVSPNEIKQRYRRLAMRHHPDRGGDTVTLQRLNEAMTILGSR